MTELKEYLLQIITPFKLPVNTQDEKQVLIASILMKFGMGGFMAFGAFQIYMFSYFYHIDNGVNLAFVNSISMLSFIPIAIFVLGSIKIAEKITYKKLFRICSLIYPLGLFLCIFIKDIYIFMAVTMIVVGVPVGLLVFPSLNCLISYFPQHIGKGTAILLATIQISSFLFSILGQYIMNPHNKQANIPYFYNDKNQQEVQLNQNQGLQEEKSTLNLFEEEIAQNYVKLLFLLGFCCGIFASIGGLLMKNKHEEDEIILKNLEQNKIQDIQQEQSIQQISVDQNQEQKQKLNLQQWNELKDMKQIQSSNVENQNQNQNQFPKSINQTRKKSDYVEFDEENYAQNQNQEEQIINLTVLQALLKKPFLIISFITMMIAMYKMFLSSNFKTYLLLKINDDKFLTFLNSFSTLLGSIFSILWGHAVDKYSIKNIYIIATVFYMGLTIIFPFCTNTKFLLSLSYFAINVVELGIFALIIPAIYKFYGKKLAPKLVPFKFLGVILGYLFLPFLSYYVISTGNFDQVFLILGILQCTAVLVALNIKDSYELI